MSKYSIHEKKLFFNGFQRIFRKLFPVHPKNFFKKIKIPPFPSDFSPEFGGKDL